LISGNLPGKTEVSSVYINGLVESGDTQAAAAVSVTLLALALVVLLSLAYLTRRWAARRG
jgi:sulfate transport system permease protein